MKKKKIIVICATVVVILGILTWGIPNIYLSMLCNDTSKFIEYEENSDGTIAITGLKGTWLNYFNLFWRNKSVDLVIPEEVDEKKVTVLGSHFAINVSPTSIELPNSIRIIESAALSGNRCSCIKIPNGVTSIGDWAWGSASLEQLWIPSSVMSIGANHIYADEVLYTPQGSYAESWAKQHNVKNIEYYVEEEYYNETESSIVKNIANSLLESHVDEIVYFGRYEQDNDTSNGSEEIAWRVLSSEITQNGVYKKMYLVSEYILDFQQYHDTYDATSWRYNSLWYWLNDSFLHSAFTTEENELISTNHPSYSGMQKIGLLTEKQIEEYFSNADACKTTATAYAQARAKTLDQPHYDWWLGEDSSQGAKLVMNGDTLVLGTLYNKIGERRVWCYYGVRPTIEILIEIEQD